MRDAGGQPTHLRKRKAPLSQRTACLVSSEVPSLESIQKQGLVNRAQAGRGFHVWDEGSQPLAMILLRGRVGEGG